jgi:flagellar biosynthetic protein FlhB
MSDDDQDDSSKTEDPTPKKLEEARRKGQVPLSREVNNWIMLLAATIVVLAIGPSVMADLLRYMRTFIEQPHMMPGVPGGFGVVLGDTFWAVIKILMLPFLVLVTAAFVGPFAQVGAIFAPNVIKPDLSKISPVKGMERLFSKRSLLEFVKGILKLAIIASVGTTILMPFYGGIDHMVGLDPIALLHELSSMVARLMMGILVVLVVVAVIDLVYQRQEHYKKMRMTKQELKDEYKQSEGDPHVKAKLRQLRQEKARARMMQSVPGADVVITNPTHFSVALKYDPETMGAPVVVAKGADDVAFRIREIAKENDVIIVENPPLARVLFNTVDIDEIIPAEHYQAVAEVISYVFRLKGKLKTIQ